LEGRQQIRVVEEAAQTAGSCHFIVFILKND
jgi:hypothetical protein